MTTPNVPNPSDNLRPNPSNAPEGATPVIIGPASSEVHAPQQDFLPLEHEYAEAGEIHGGFKAAVMSVSKAEVRFRDGVLADKPENGRNPNQDNCHVVADNGLFLVADGVGGHAGGEEASTSVVNSFDRIFSGRRPATVEEAKDLLKAALSAARTDVEKRRQELGISTDVGMGSTLAAGIIVGNQLVALNVGDSAIMVKRGGEMHHVTTEQGHRNVVNNAIGLTDSKGIVEYNYADKDATDENERLFKDEIVVFDLQPGDRIVAASDGILGDTADQKLEDYEYVQALADVHPSIAAQELIDASKKTDDRTAIVIDYDPKANNVGPKKTPTTATSAPGVSPTPKVVTPPKPKMAKKLSGGESSGDQLQKEIETLTKGLARVEKRIIGDRIAAERGEPHSKDSVEANTKQYVRNRQSLRAKEIEILRAQGITDEDTLKGLVEFADAIDNERLVIKAAETARAMFVDFNTKMRIKQGLDPRYTAERAKRLSRAYIKLKDEAGIVVAKQLRDMGATDDEINLFAQDYSLDEAQALQKDIANAWMSKGPRSKLLRKFFNKWDEWGSGEQVLNLAGLKKDKNWKSWKGIKENINLKAAVSKGNLKRSAVLGAVAVPAGIAGSVVLGGIGIGAGVGAILSRSAARTAANIGLSNKSEGTVRTQAQEASKASFEKATAAMVKAVDENRCITTADIIGDVVEVSANKLKSNRRRLVGTVAVGAAAGLIGAAAGNLLFGRFRGDSIAHTSDHAGTPPTTTGGNAVQPQGGGGAVAVPGTGTTIEHGTGTTIPRGPGTTIPRSPGTTIDQAPTTTAAPGTTIPRGPGTTQPNAPGTTVPRGPGTTQPNGGPSVPQQPNGPSVPKLENMTAEQEKVWNSLSSQDQAKVYAWMHSKDSEKFFAGYKANYDHVVKTHPDFNQGTTTADIQNNLHNPSFTNPQGTGALDKSIAQSTKLAEEMQKAQVKQYAAGLKAVEDHSGLKVGTPEFDAKLPSYVAYAQQVETNKNLGQYLLGLKAVEDHSGLKVGTPEFDAKLPSYVSYAEQIQQAQLNQFLQGVRIQELIAQGMSPEEAEKLVLGSI